MSEWNFNFGGVGNNGRFAAAKPLQKPQFRPINRKTSPPPAPGRSRNCLDDFVKSVKKPRRESRVNHDLETASSKPRSESTGAEDEVMILLNDSEVDDPQPTSKRKFTSRNLEDNVLEKKTENPNFTSLDLFPSFVDSKSPEKKSDGIPDLLPLSRFGEKEDDRSPNKRINKGVSLKNCNGMAFDFSGDPKVGNLKKKIMSIIDPDGKRVDALSFSTSLDAAARRGVEMERCYDGKKKGRNAIKTLASWNDFKSAGGGGIVKEMKKVVPEHASDESQGSDIGNKRYLGNKRITGTNGFNAPTLIKKGLESMGIQNEQPKTGLRAEPSLKHFDENIISLIESEIMSITRETGWSDVAGLDGAKKALREIVVLPFKRPDVFKGIRAPPKGVLLFGPPGTGKTMIGRCVASQCKATFFNISASSLTSKWVGEGEKLVRALFAVARLKLPSVIFIDEIDSLLSSRSETEHESSRRIKTEFLVQLDGVATNSDERLLVLGATNRPQELDEAARRRFAKRLYIALPERDARISIVRLLLGDMVHDINDHQLSTIGSITEGYSGADMRQLCAEASMGPIRDVDNSSTMDIETVETEEIRPINVDDFREAARVVRPTVAVEELVAYSDWDKKFGCLL